MAWSRAHRPFVSKLCEARFQALGRDTHSFATMAKPRTGILGRAAASTKKQTKNGPALSTRGVKAAQASRAQAHSAVRTLIDKWLDEHQESWNDVWANISTVFFDSDVAGGKGHDSEGGTWDASVCTFEQVDKQWLAQVLAMICGVSLPLLDLVDAEDGRGLRKLFVTWTGFPLRMPVEGHLRDKQVMHRFIELRWEDLGKRSGGFQLNATSSGVVNWAKVAPWTFEWAEGKVVKLRHNLAGEACLCADVGPRAG